MWPWLPLAGLVGQAGGIMLLLDRGRFFLPVDLLLLGGLMASGVYFFRPGGQESGLGPAELQAIIREKNHAYLNHLQVLSGWSEMGLPAPRPYLERTIQAAAKERELDAVPYPGLVMTLLWAKWQAQMAGIEWECRLQGKIAGGRDEAVRDLQQVFAGKVERLGRMRERRRLEVTVDGRAGGTMVEIRTWAGEAPEVERVWLPGG